MASDLSSGCTDAIEVLDEREEGEISLEDVSSSEEGHPNYGYGTRTTRCVHCHSIQHCAPWCTSTKYYHLKNSNRKDAVQEKENRHYAKDSGSMGVKHAASTLQEKNDDLVPISSDSDMEIVGLTDNSKQILIRSLSRSRCKKKKKKKRTHTSALSIDDFVSSSSIDLTVAETTLKHDNDNTKGDRLPRSHHRELSPVHSRARSRGNTKSPSRRHRASVWIQSPIRKSRSPIMRSRSPMLRRSPRRLRSPKRSPYRSPPRAIPKKNLKNELSPSNTSAEMYGNVDKLLKKVRHLDSVGIHAQEENARIREHSSSLKEKLSNMMKGMSDNNGNVTNCTKEKTIMHVEANNDADDEEDLALLRQKALETKQKRIEKSNEQTKSELENKTIVYNDDDHDEEDLELRMIALRSAVLKKHQNRVQRGVKSKKHANSTISRSESPFTQSFLDSIPISNENRTDSPPSMYISASHENTHTEDMELDTDVEREKEKLPYSPTDNITIDIPIDTELLGIEPSDVSFINLNRRISSPPFDNTNIHLEDRTLGTGIIENQSFLPNIMNCTDTETMFYKTNADAPYSPSDSIETSKSDVAVVKHSGTSISTSQFNSTHCSTMNDVPDANGICTEMDIAMGQERPYSPTDAPIYDPDLSQTLPLIQTLHSSNNSYIMPIEAMYNTSYGNSSVANIDEKSQLQYSAQQKNMSENKHIGVVEKIVTRTENDSPRFSEAGSISPNDSMITIDDLLDTDLDPSPSGSASQNLENIETTSSNSVHKITKLAEEPLYMQGIPDVTKDINKIPTLINRTLVPAPILKSNKQLQQPLLTKKHENQVEPTFKSAEMQPVSIDFNINAKSSTQFKPMKLSSVTKKSQTILATPIAFQGFLNDDTTNKTSKDTIIPPSKEEHDITCSKNISMNSEKAIVVNNTDSVPKKKKRKRRGGRRRNSNVTEIVNNRISNKSIEGSKHDSSVLESEAPNANIISGSVESQCSNIHEKQDNISNIATSTDSNNTKLIQSDQDSKSTLFLDENCIKNKASVPSNEIQKHDTAQLPTSLKTHNNSCPEVVDKTNVATNRRPSLDEDEDTLRAILLASLAKRTKSSDVSSNNTPPIIATATISNVSTMQSTQKATMGTATPPLSMHQTVQNDTKSYSLSQSTIPYNFGDEKHHHAYAMPLSSTDIAKEHAVGISTDAVSASLLTNPIRKRQLPMPKGPTRKYVKKVSIPASTKVVNNAKKYQNTVVQRKLILQKAASIYNAEKLKDVKPVSNIKTCENKWTSNTKTISSDAQRIVINLESDTESDSEHERLKANSTSVLNSKKMEKRQVLTIPTTDFEKSVDQFLRHVRKKHETAAANKPTIPTHNAIKKNSVSVTSAENKISPTVHTPSAVRHLPVSKQEEYRRLKQQILEREILKLQRSVESGTSKKVNSTSTTSHSTISDNLSKESQQSLKEDQNILPKVQDLNLQISIKNNNDGNTEGKKNTNNTLKSSAIPTSVEKDFASNNAEKRSNEMSYSKAAPLQVTSHINVRISNELASNQNNGKINTTESNVALLDAKSKLQNTSLQDIKKPKTSDASLKVLTKDEVNHKFVQIQVKQHEAGRIVTINNKANLSENIELEHCTKNSEEKENNEINGNKEDNIHIGPEEDQTKEQNEINKTNNCIYNRISIEQNEGEKSTREEEIVPNDTNNLNRLHENCTIEDENTRSEQAMEKDQRLLTSVQPETHDHTSLNVSNLDTSSDNDLLPTTNNIEENKIANVEELWESIKKDIKTELTSLIHLPRLEQKRHLMDTEHKLVMKRYTVLDDLAEMSGDLRQWDMERDLQTNLVEEVKKLREQLKIAEEKLRVHRNRVNNIGPKVMAAHEKINNGRRECFKLSRICMVLGTKVVGQDYKIPQAGAHLLDNKLKEVANHTRQLSKKKVPSVHISENYMLLEKHAILPTHTEIPQNNSPEILPVEKETGNVEHSQTIQDDCNENNNTIVSKDENILTSTNIENSLEVEEDKEKNNICETNDTIEQDDYCDRISESELCDGPASLKQDCDIDRFTEGGTQILRDVDHPRKITIEPYVSMLTHLKVPRMCLCFLCHLTRNANPNGVLCPYELMGTCNDGDCQFVHQSASHVL